MIGNKRFHSVDSKEKLNVGRLFGPERAIVVEDGNTHLERHEIGTSFNGYSGHKIQNGRFREPIAPGLSGSSDMEHCKRPQLSEGHQSVITVNSINLFSCDGIQDGGISPRRCYKACVTQSVSCLVLRLDEYHWIVRPIPRYGIPIGRLVLVNTALQLRAYQRGIQHRRIVQPGTQNNAIVRVHACLSRRQGAHSYRRAFCAFDDFQHLCISLEMDRWAYYAERSQIFQPVQSFIKSLSETGVIPFATFLSS